MFKKCFILLLFLANIQISISQNNSKIYSINQNVIFEENFYSLGKKKVSKRKIKLELKSSDGKPLGVDFRIQLSKKSGLPANVKFGNLENSNKLFINFFLAPSLIANGNIDSLSYYYELKNNQSVKIKFKQWSFNILSTPIRMNFIGGKTRFSTGPNLGALLGHSWGKTKFMCKSNIGNNKYETKQTFGFYMGVDKVNFLSPDDSNSYKEIEAALLSPGLGYLYSYQNFTFGTTLGVDFALGENNSDWSFQGSPWIGVNLGYSLFAF